MRGAGSEATAVARIDPASLARDTSRLVRVPSVTGGEREVMECFRESAVAAGLRCEIVEHDHAEIRSHPGYPGQVAERSALVGAEAVLPDARPGAPRLLINGHLDVVSPGAQPWSGDPWSGAIDGGRVHGRGSVDMKGGVVAALHAMLAIRVAVGSLPGDVVLQVVASEEDGGQGAFAALERDSDFGGCIIPEPAGLSVVCAHGGSLQAEVLVRGVSAHAATRLAGASAIDRFVPLHAALGALEARLNTDVTHPLMRMLQLPYPVVVGTIAGGRWVSQVPDEVRFTVRVGVPVGRTVESVWEELTATLGAASQAIERSERTRGVPAKPAPPSGADLSGRR